MALFSPIISNVDVISLRLSTVSWRYGNIFNLVGFMSLLAAKDVKMKCNNAQFRHCEMIHKLLLSYHHTVDYRK